MKKAKVNFNVDIYLLFCEKNIVSLNVSSFTKSGFKGIYQCLKLQGKFFDQMCFMIFAHSHKHSSSILLGKTRLITVHKLTWLNADFFKTKLFKLWHFIKSPSNNTNTSYWIGPHIARKSSRITTCHSWVLKVDAEILQNSHLTLRNPRSATAGKFLVSAAEQAQNNVSSDHTGWPKTHLIPTQCTNHTPVCSLLHTGHAKPCPMHLSWIPSYLPIAQERKKITALERNWKTWIPFPVPFSCLPSSSIWVWPIHICCSVTLIDCPFFPSHCSPLHQDKTTQEKHVSCEVC